MTTPQHAAQPTPSSRSILSRIALPFRPKPRHISDFHVETDEPFRHHAPGDVVKGSVFLSVLRPVRVTHIVLSLHGFVKVFKSAHGRGDALAGEGSTWGPGRGTRGADYLGNGLASIFEDEIVLCGEGRLTVNTYAFRFELRFPASGIPSSIDFERGSISYMLTATLTRPIAIAPTMSCERKITLAESIDIAGLGKPKARVITLKPIRRTKPRAQVKLSMAYAHKAKEPAAGPQPFHRSSPSTQGRPADPPLSPAPSAVSSASVVSSDASVPAASELAQPDRGFSDEQNNGEDRPDGTISVTIEILRGACLPGDSIPLVISIAHTKVIKSVQGIIITLYRLGRVDRQPIVPIGLSMKGKGPADEEYYPRSRTGLGGLSLSSADSTHAFRMDLAQTFAPLLIDPATLTATVNTSIQVPDDVFPTISCTPGAMITFKYFVEVVVDIRGKLAGYDRFFPRITMTGTPSGYGHPRVPNQPTAVRQHVAMTTEPMVDAEQIRRDKSVISCLFEVVVGTKDSRRKVVKQKPGLWEDGTQLEEGDPDSREFDGRYANEESMIGGDADTYEPLQYDYHDESWEDRMTTRGPVLIRPPRLEEAHDEKARVRMAEERLLPSAPPDGDDGSSSACPTGCLPSAPTLNDIQEEYRQDGPSAPAYPGHGTVLDDTTAPGSTGFAYLGNTEPSAQPTFHCCDDKQELERQRLLAAASAPPDSDIDDDEEAGQSGPPRVSVPTAPVLDHNGAYDPAHSATDGQMPLSET